MRGLPLLLFAACAAAAAAAAQASPSQLFGNVVSAVWLTEQPMALLDFALDPAAADMGATTHFWATGADDRVDDVVIEYFVDGEANASVSVTPSLLAGAAFGGGIEAPWGTAWAGKGGKTGAWFSRLRVPFQQSLRVTARLAEPGLPMMFYAQVRGATNIALLPHSGLQIPATARLSQTVVAGRALQPLDWADLVDVPSGDGVVFATQVAVNNSLQTLNFLEGCHHVYTPHAAPFPGILVSSGTEDYYDSSYYFSAGEYAMPASGLTTLSRSSEAGNGTLFAAYRYHDYDPLPFSGGVRLAWRNGDLAALKEGGSKCFSETVADGVMIGRPGVSQLWSYGWAYVW